MGLSAEWQSRETKMRSMPDGTPGPSWGLGSVLSWPTPRCGAQWCGEGGEGGGEEPGCGAVGETVRADGARADGARAGEARAGEARAGAGCW